MFKHITVSICCILVLVSSAVAQQHGVITGSVTTPTALPLEGMTVSLDRTNYATKTNEDGKFELSNIPAGSYTLQIRGVGYQNLRKPIVLAAGQTLTIDEILREDNLSINEVVVSATRYGVDRREAAVIVNVISPKLFNATQSVAMSETLNFQPGVRVETNCQNCGFSQVRLNGLEGGYSQILINSRSVFSALNSVYGLDQIPTSMVDRIEVVRSGGSALFGSNAIAGTINIITKDPVENNWQIGMTSSLIDGNAWDNTVDFNTSLITDDLTNGVTFYGMNRNRQAYDYNGDGFSEITKMNNTTFGSKAFFRPTDFNKITLDLSVINEFRRGGDQLNLAPHLTDITEQLDHKTFIGGLSYEHYSRDYKSQFSAYLSAQGTTRESFYGGLAGSYTATDSIAAANSYGHTDDFSIVSGVQYTKTFEQDVITAGAEHQYNQTKDEIGGYNRLVDQTNNNFGIYAQYEWKPLSDFTALIGARFDQVNVDGIYRLKDLNRTSDVSANSFSPRLTILYDISPELQFRGGYARGFRAPQAFNEDMHVSSAGGEQVFVLISDDLETEYSNAYTGSLNYTKSIGATQFNALVEGFFTDLLNPFTNVRTNTLDGVILDEMRNGEGAYVAGTNIEFSFAPSDKYSFQAGGTIQQSKYRTPQTIIEADEDAGDPEITVDRFVRSPNAYGFLNSNWKPSELWSIDVTGVYTGSMIVPHQVNRTLLNSENFFELNFRLGRIIQVNEHFTVEVSAGIQNAMNSFQKDFDIGPERDADYVYGPSRPRTFFFGLKIGHFH